MGFGDVFIAATLGALLARRERRWQLRGALLVALVGCAFDLLFFAVDELPATVPTAYHPGGHSSCGSGGGGPGSESG